MLVYSVVGDWLSPTSPVVGVVEIYVRREDAERLIEEVCRDDPEIASYLRIEERELEGGRALSRALASRDENLQLFRATRPRQQPHKREQVPHDEYTNDQSTQPSLDHDKSSEPNCGTPQRAADEFANPTRRAITSIVVAEGTLVLAAGALICLEVDGLSPLTRTRTWRPPFTGGSFHQPTASATPKAG